VDWESVKAGEVVVVAAGADVGDRGAYARFLERGMALLLEPAVKAGGGFSAALGEVAESPAGVLPGVPADAVKVVRSNGDFADCLVPDLLAGLDPMDLHWWTARRPDGVVRVCRASYQFPEGTPGVTGLVRHVQHHAYIQEKDWPRFVTWPVFEVRTTGGAVIVSSMLLADDPVARRFYGNLIERLRKRAAGGAVEHRAEVKD
jgi:hypothetical protein